MSGIIECAVRDDDVTFLTRFHKLEWQQDIGVQFAERTQYRFDTLEQRQAKNEDDRIEYHAGGGLCWINAHGQKQCVYVSNGGVLEYFSQPELEELYSKVATDCGPSTFLIIEPIAGDHDLQAQTHSKPLGAEKSFSHNHRYLLEKHGFNVIHASERSSTSTAMSRSSPSAVRRARSTVD